MPTHSPAAELLEEFRRWPILDVHSHIDPRRPAARDFGEILGYHYYTELCHSAGMPAAMVDPSRDSSERCRNLAAYLGRIDNTVQYSWLLEIARTFHGFQGEAIDPSTIDELCERAQSAALDGPSWDRRVWERSNLEAVFLTSDFDDKLDDFDTSKYVPCLRCDDLVLKLHLPSTIARLRRATGVDVADFATLRSAAERLFVHFVAKGAKACAISLPPDFAPRPGSPKRASTPIRRAIHGLELRPDEHDEVRATVFWMLAELCEAHKLPFDLMIGPIRDAYPAGVAGGRDLFDRRVSLADYRGLFAAFPGVTFPVSTLSPDAAAELVAYAWIFPNVVPLGHWWYSNVPTYIAADLTARLEAVPKTSQVGYYSDAYKLEFVLPKFEMYRRILADVLAGGLVGGRGWTVERAADVGRHLLVDNPRRTFGL